MTYHARSNEKCYCSEICSISNEINILKVSLDRGHKQSETTQFVYARFILIRVRLWCDNARGLCCFRDAKEECIFKEHSPNIPQVHLHIINAILDLVSPAWN